MAFLNKLQVYVHITVKDVIYFFKYSHLAQHNKAAPQESTAQQLSFERAHFRISSTGAKA